MTGISGRHLRLYVMIEEPSFDYHIAFALEQATYYLLLST
jgi:hypothetical protein